MPMSFKLNENEIRIIPAKEGVNLDETELGEIRNKIKLNYYAGYRRNVIRRYQKCPKCQSFMNFSDGSRPLECEVEVEGNGNIYIFHTAWLHVGTHGDVAVPPDVYEKMKADEII